MLYKHSFSILCGHLNLNKKRKKIKFDRLPVKPAGKPVKPVGIPVRTGWTAKFEFKFEFHRYWLVSGQTGPVYQYRTAPVWPDPSITLTLRATQLWLGTATNAAQAKCRHNLIGWLLSRPLRASTETSTSNTRCKTTCSISPSLRCVFFTYPSAHTPQTIDVYTCDHLWHSLPLTMFLLQFWLLNADIREQRMRAQAGGSVQHGGNVTNGPSLYHWNLKPIIGLESHVSIQVALFGWC